MTELQLQNHQVWQYLTDIFENLDFALPLGVGDVRQSQTAISV